MSLMGIDIGTSGCKTAIYSVSGTQISSCRRSYSPILTHPGRMEFDCKVMLDAILETIKEAIKESNDKRDPVTALSVGSFSEAVVPISKDGTILGNSIAGSDNRHSSSIDILKKIDPQYFYTINPNILSFTYTYPKLAWYRDEMPEVYANVWKFLNWSDFLVYYLTSSAASTYSHANRTLLFDIRAEDWSDELLERVNIDRSKLADTVPSGTVMGVVKPDVARSLGFTTSVSVVSGGHDQCLNALGSGAIQEGQSVTGIGTFECTTIVFDSLPDQKLMLSLNLNIEHHVLTNKYVTLIYNQGGSLQTWFMKVFAKELIKQKRSEREILEILTNEAPNIPTSLIFIPTIEPTGAPYFFAGMNGSFHNIHAGTTRGDMYRALLEGESMYSLETITTLATKGFHMDEIIASGGGSRSDLWLQIKADIFGKTVKRTSFIDSGTVGAALLAGIATKEYSTAQEAIHTINKNQTLFTPNKENNRLYQQHIESFQKMFNEHGST